MKTALRILFFAIVVLAAQMIAEWNLAVAVAFLFGTILGSSR